MAFIRSLAVVAVLYGAVLTLHARVLAQTPTAQPASATTTPIAGPPRNSTASLYTEVCAGCHGADCSGGRAPSLFDATWLHGSDDASIEKNIKDGFPAAGMVPFKDTLNDQQIWQLVAYIRTQESTLKGRPQYVPDPADQIVKSEKQTFKIEIVTKGLETPWGLAFLPDGRLLITERPGRLRIVENGKLLPDGVKGLPKVWE